MVCTRPQTQLTGFSHNICERLSDKFDRFCAHHFLKTMASKSEISSLEDILDKHLPEPELAEAKRILYGRQLE